MKSLLLGFTLCIAYSGMSQPVLPLLPAGGNPEMHQIFLETPIQGIERIEYRDTGEPIEHELSPDGKAIYLKSYDGKSPVSVSVINADGQAENFVRSRCQIDAYIPEI